MNLTTEVYIEKPQFLIDHSDNILSLGSCFSDNIANRLKKLKFNILTNPFGVLYNPISISNALSRIISKKKYTIEDIQRHNKYYFSFHHHSSFNSLDESKFLNNINSALIESFNHWEKLSTLIITFGTSFVYELNSNKEIVANCHKLPASEFNRRLLSPKETVSVYSEMFSKIKNMNPDLKIILTISPVRHLRDNAHENQISKAHLFTAVNEIISSDNSIYYFPSYEIIMDELRDYRFYAEDMVHPSKVAEKYIFEKFSECIITKKSRQLIDDYKTILKAKEHKIMSTIPEEIGAFKKSMLKKVNSIKAKYNNIDFSEDLQYFSN